MLRNRIKIDIFGGYTEKRSTWRQRLNSKGFNQKFVQLHIKRKSCFLKKKKVQTDLGLDTQAY